jgi:hypothetical protein
VEGVVVVVVVIGEWCFGVGVMVVVKRESLGWFGVRIDTVMYIYVYALPPCFASWICGYDLIDRWFDAQMIRLSNFDR